MAQAAEYSFDIAQGDLTLTPAARTKLAELAADAESGVEVIRIFVSGGGCGGMGYGMTFAEGANEYDSMLTGEGYRIAIDPVALNFLRGAEIDFVDDNFIFGNVFQSVGGSGRCGGCSGGGGF